MTRLVAIDPAIPGPALLAAVERTWADGDAVVVLPRPAPASVVRQLLATARPHLLLEPDDDGRVRSVTLGADAPNLEPGDALVVASSGSTGEPKLLVHTHGGLEAHAVAVHRHLGVDPAVDRWLACLPLHHLGGFGVISRALLTGTAVDIALPFDAATVASSPASLGTTLVSLVPTALDRLDPAAFRWVVLGGSADPGDRPSNVVRTYGLTETGGGIAYDGVALPGVELAVRRGEIVVRSATLARGRRRADGGVDPLVDDDGWLATGDLGRLVDGRLEVHGRADDLIVTGGENVWPGPVEDVLRSHPAVAEAMVHGEPDPEWGQRVVATVVPVEHGRPPSLQDLRAHVAEVLPRHAAPREVRMAAALDRTALGKLRRPRPGRTAQ